MANIRILSLMQKLVVKAVSLAIARDGASGGVVRTVTVSTSQFSALPWCSMNILILELIVET